MSLANVWLQTLSDGLVRADRVVGIDVHQTPALTGKAPHWLLDVVLPTSIGSGARGEWDLSMLHRTLTQTSTDPGDAAVLARLLAQLDAINAAGIVTTSGPAAPAARSGSGDDLAAIRSNLEETATDRTSVRFTFVPFPHPAPGHHTGAEYL